MNNKSSQCPICGKSSSPEEIPFCSKRCREVDLNRWLNNGYSIPAADQTPVNDNEQSE